MPGKAKRQQSIIVLLCLVVPYSRCVCCYRCSSGTFVLLHWDGSKASFCSKTRSLLDPALSHLTSSDPLLEIVPIARRDHTITEG
mmetsp:Transcript_6470/g.14705  ORF Transcript_6470/g.14705 Transcript_6470/m.14705 type:complete len:85 (+) Transcript_6470:1538-1792(+)